MAKEINMEFLYRAVDENANITVYLIKDKKEEKDEYRSRFLGYDRKEKVIFIDEVTGEGRSYQPLLKGEKIRVFFQYDEFRFIFSSEVLDKTYYAINERLKLPSYKIRMPQSLEDGDRRQFFRVPTPMDKPIIVEFKLYPYQSKEPMVDPENPEGSPKIFKGVAIDISGGGIAIKAEKGNNFEIGDIFDMKFKLSPQDKEFLYLKGIVRNKRKYFDTDLNIYGVEFVEENSINFKKAINRIIRYVFERQREMLAK